MKTPHTNNAMRKNNKWYNILGEELFDWNEARKIDPVSFGSGVQENRKILPPVYCRGIGSIKSKN